MSLIKKNRLYILAFAIPVFIMILMYIIRGIYPFGDQCYLRSDMYHQYAPFLKEFFNKITSSGSFLYSWNIGMGVDFIPLYSYYLASPLNWFVFLVPSAQIIEVMSFFIIIKIGLMGFTFSYYCRKHFNTKHIVIAVFSSFYALSSYLAAFSWNLMWLDCLLLFPLVILGLEKLIKEGKYLLYFISLSLCIISNYYIAIMICIFSLIYFIYFSILNSFTLKSTIKFAVYSLLAGGLSAFLLIPTFNALSLTASGNFSFPESIVNYFPIYQLLSRGLINVDAAIFSAHDPNIYSSVAVFLFVPLFALSKKIKLKEKIGKIILLVFMLISFNINYLDYIWHGFHFPNSLPARQSFIFIFLILIISFEAFVNMNSFTKKQLFGTFSGAVGLILLFEIFFVDTDYISPISIYISIIFIALYLALFTLFKTTKLSRNLLFYIFFIIAALEIIINTNQTALGTTSRVAYTSDNQAIEELVSNVKENDKSFYRIEKYSRRSKNDAAWHNYMGVSVFSSTASAGLNEFLSSFGFESSANAYAFYGHTPLTSSLLSVKYMISNEELSNSNLITLVDKKDDIYIYENNYTLPIAFMAKEDLELTVNFDALNPFEVQNSFVYNATGYNSLFTEYTSTK